ncbi:hypothetical protein [Microvirga brassicacearum]|nr:hypothetical protein [Microvirga brassicacearum]
MNKSLDAPTNRLIFRAIPRLRTIAGIPESGDQRICPVRVRF